MLTPVGSLTPRLLIIIIMPPIIVMKVSQSLRKYYLNPGSRRWFVNDEHRLCGLLTIIIQVKQIKIDSPCIIITCCFTETPCTLPQYSFEYWMLMCV